MVKALTLQGVVKPLLFCKKWCFQQAYQLLASFPGTSGNEANQLLEHVWSHTCLGATSLTAEEFP